MAKDLPYFKFFCSEWNDGDITLEDYNIQGVFINVCSYYWSRECNLEPKMLYKRFKTVKPEIDILVSENFIKIENNIIEISFLDEQKEEREKRSKIRSKGGKASAEARKLKKLQQESNTYPTEIQHVLNSSSTQPQLLREDKRREEEIREDVYTQQQFLQRWKDARLHFDKKPTNISKLKSFDVIKFEEIKKTYSSKQIEQAIQGMFEQKTFASTRLHPSHFLELEHFEKYLTCFTTKEKLFDNKKYVKTKERI
tara:strand:- start:2955 stop:3716 length:762 start_codon:yes stop_codon:yes gene_type:complete